MADELREGKDHLPRYLRVGEEIALNKSFLQPLGEVDYSDTKTELNVGDIKISMTHEPVSWLTIDPDKFDSYGGHEDIGYIGKYYTLHDFTISQQNGEGKVMLREILPDDATILFDPAREIDESTVSGKTIILHGDPASPGGIVTLLHEVGHFINDDESNQALLSSHRSLNKEHDDFSSEEAATIIKSERDAWAFALRKLRPLITKDGVFTKEKFFAFMRYCLNGYSTVIGGRITQGVEADEAS